MPTSRVVCFLASMCVGIAIVAPALSAADATDGSQNTHFPRPTELTPNVAFWKKIYTDHGVGDFVLHDRDKLGVVYAIVRVRETHNQGRAADLAKPEIERLRAKYRDILLRLASGAAVEGLGDDERRVAEAWGCPCQPDVLRRAAENIRVQQGLREKVDEGLRRAQRLLPQIVTILQKHNVPAELAALPMVESTFNPAAYSKAGAVGLWQFIRSTGKRYLTVTRRRDDRRDPIRATEAAAHLLRNNYAALGSWPLAIVAYNHGHAGVQAASVAVGSKAIEDIVTRYNGPRFGFASKNFYAEFLAALDVVHPYIAGHGKVVGSKARRRATEQASLPAPAPTAVAPPVETPALASPTPPLEPPVEGFVTPVEPERSNGEPVPLAEPEQRIEPSALPQDVPLGAEPETAEHASVTPAPAEAAALPAPDPAAASAPSGDAAAQDLEPVEVPPTDTDSRETTAQ